MLIQPGQLTHRARDSTGAQWPDFAYFTGTAGFAAALDTTLTH